MTVYAVIPARSGSKGVPDKNIKKLGGHALIEWAIKSCLKCPDIDKVIVSTDSQEYAEIANSFGALTPFIRPSEISGDRSTDYDFMKHAIEWFQLHDELPAYIAHIRPTTPYRSPEIISEAIKLFKSSEHATALRSVHEMSETAYKSLEISSEGLLMSIGNKSTQLDVVNNARQSFPVTYQANGYVDIIKTDFVMKMKLLHGDRVIPFLTSRATEVDSIEDFDYLEYLLTKNSSIYRSIFD
jgi:CMP-N,N'-diacetyllegionaminic acid synthase